MDVSVLHFSCLGSLLITFHTSGPGCAEQDEFLDRLGAKYLILAVILRNEPDVLDLLLSKSVNSVEYLKQSVDVLWHTPDQ